MWLCVQSWKSSSKREKKKLWQTNGSLSSRWLDLRSLKNHFIFKSVKINSILKHIEMMRGDWCDHRTVNFTLIRQYLCGTKNVHVIWSVFHVTQRAKSTSIHSHSSQNLKKKREKKQFQQCKRLIYSKLAMNSKFVVVFHPNWFHILISVKYEKPTFAHRTVRSQLMVACLFFIRTII